MSAEGKKKRGESGVANARAKPYRLNGRAPDWQAREMGAFRGAPAPSSGSKTMVGLIGGILASRLGYPMYGKYDNAVDHAQARCSHPMLTAGRDDLPITDERAA